MKLSQDKRSHKRSHDSKRLVAYALFTALAVILRGAYKKIERQAKTNKARELSHAYLDTISDRSDCDIEGLRFLSGTLSAKALSDLTKDPSVIDSTRIYAGLACGKTPNERVEWALAEMDRLSAWEKKALLLIVPTGRGYVHGIPLETCEIAYRGNHAAIAVQYADDRSMRAITKLDDGISAHVLLLDAVFKKLAERKASDLSIPQVNVYGESMGAWGSLEAMIDVNHLPDRALWVGSPKPLWKKTIPRVKKKLANAGEVLTELNAAPITPVKYLALTNDDDPIAYFEGVKTAVIPTKWVWNKKKYWLPGITWAQLIIEMEAQTRPEKGVMGKAKHDYRGHMLQAIPQVFGGETLTAKEVLWLTEREATRHQIFKFLYTLPIKGK